MYQRERLNFEQIQILKERHPDNNRTKFFERVSKVIVTDHTDWNILSKFQEHDLECEVIFKSDKLKGE